MNDLQIIERFFRSNRSEEDIKRYFNRYFSSEEFQNKVDEYLEKEPTFANMRFDMASTIEDNSIKVRSRSTTFKIVVGTIIFLVIAWLLIRFLLPNKNESTIKDIVTSDKADTLNQLPQAVDTSSGQRLTDGLNTHPALSVNVDSAILFQSTASYSRLKIKVINEIKRLDDKSEIGNQADLSTHAPILDTTFAARISDFDKTMDTGIDLMSKGYFQKANRYFNALLASNSELSRSSTSKVLWYQFLCCVADWEHLEKEGYIVYGKLEAIDTRVEYLPQAQRLRKNIHKEGFWNPKKQLK